jgi:hypothetical protein
LVLHQLASNLNGISWLRSNSLKLVPSQIGPLEGELAGALLMAVVCSGMAFIPFYDKGDDPAKSKLATYYGVVLLLAIIVFTIWGALS